MSEARDEGRGAYAAAEDRRNGKVTSLVRAGGRGGLFSFLGALVSISFRFIVWFFAGPASVRLHQVGRRGLQAAALLRVGIVGLLIYLAGWGLSHPALAIALLAALFIVTFAGFLVRQLARDRLFDVATRPLRLAAPLDGASLSAPRVLAARPLQELALAVDRLRRGDVFGARDLIVDLDEGRLELDERRLLDAVRALVAARTGDSKTAAIRALDALPTHASDLDEQLARILLENAAHDAIRLRAMLESWEARGLLASGVGYVPRLMRYALVKLNRLDPASLPNDERLTHLELARELHDNDMTSRLSAANAPTSFR
ncbi:MAG: hypothetical protein U0271_20735 [Polyangiaceae bacterium]